MGETTQSHSWAGVATAARPPALVCCLLGGLLIFALAIHGSAQALTLSGQVVDAETGEPLAGANVTVGSGGTTTDARGRFEWAVSPGDSIRVSYMGYETAELRSAGPSLIVRLQPTVLQVGEVIVLGGLVEQVSAEAAAGVSVLGRRQLRAATGPHLQDVIRAIPNLNSAGGTSRPRYFQIRGIGERSHYAWEGPPSSSVGFILDDVDLSGMGMAGLLFDLDQVEVFRGPQSAIFGANAMAGLISMRSADPVDIHGRAASASGGSDGLLRCGGWLNLPLRPRLAVRAGYQFGRSNGFRQNTYLDVDDSNRRREAMVRAKMRYEADNGLVLLGTAFRADLNNRYDAWTPDNNEELITYSDRPGKDSQVTTAVSVRGEIPLSLIAADLVSITAYSRTEAEHSYDGDWGNGEFWLQEPYGFDPEVQGWEYDFYDRTLRDRDTFTQELRLLKNDLMAGRGSAIIGAHVKAMEESDDASGYLFGGDATDLYSTFAVDDLALYGQGGLELTDGLRLSLNLRLDRNSIEYEGETHEETTDAQADTVAFDITDQLAGGKASLTYHLGENRTVYAALARGYKAGGVNQHPRLATHRRPYDPEYVVNLEGGYRFSGRRTTTALTLFHARRHDQQVDLSSQQDPGDPNSFVYFIANAAGGGRSSGIEAEQVYWPTTRLRLFGSLGYLNTHVDAYTFESARGDTVTLGDRAAAHAPRYTVRIGGEYRHQTGLFGQLDLSATDGFFYSDSHDEKSDRYGLVNGSVGYRGNAWSLTLWASNLLDERYPVRGFYFGLEPCGEAPLQPCVDAKKRYVSYGDPRQIGVTLRTSHFGRGAAGAF